MNIIDADTPTVITGKAAKKRLQNLAVNEVVVRCKYCKVQILTTFNQFELCPCGAWVKAPPLKRIK